MSGETWTIYRKTNSPLRIALTKQTAVEVVRGPDTEAVEVVPLTALRAVEEERDRWKGAFERVEKRLKEATASLPSSGSGRGTDG